MDNELEVSVIGAKVMLVNMQGDTLLTPSDYEGHFAFRDQPVGKYKLAVKMVGYELRQYNNLLLDAGKELVLEVRLEEEIKSMRSVQVTAKQKNGEVENEMATVSARAFSVEETSRYAGSF